MAAATVYETPRQARLTANYNSFFHPNLCHVCKKKCDLKQCPYCCMISYCSENHRKLHREQHADVCNAILKLSLFRSVKDFNGETQKEWATFKQDNVRQVESLLKRDLKPYEKQMFLFPKSCFVCHTQENLSYLCFKCRSVNICKKHQVSLIGSLIRHECNQLKRCHVLDTHNASCEREKGIFVNCIVHFAIRDLLDVSSYIERSRFRNSLYTPECILDDILLTDDLSGPLTLVYALDRACLLLQCFNFTVHIITEGIMDVRALYAWEVLFHQFYAHSSLLIETIGPALKNSCRTLQPCAICTHDRMRFHSKSHRMLYHEYVQSPLFTRPSVIAVFNVDLSSDKMSTETIRAFQPLNCPVLFTTPLNITADNNIAMIHKVLGEHINPIIMETNRFLSYRPYRDYATDSVMSPNKYFILYQNLNDTNKAVLGSNNNSSDL